MHKFEFINRGFDKNILLLPGWACDWRIFTHLDLDCNYIYAPAGDVDTEFIACYLKEHKFHKVSVLGFSMGSFTAARFAEDHAAFIERLFLVSTTIKPDAMLMDHIKAKIDANHRAFLIRFYINCFARNDIEALRLFRRDILQDYLARADKDILLEGLNFLRGASLSSEGINKVDKVTIYHGEEDKVFPLKDILPITQYCPKVELNVFADTGHILLFNHKFLHQIRQLCKS